MLKCWFSIRQRSVQIIVIALIQICLQKSVSGHGRLMEPPSRNSMWRFGFPNPVDYNDNELYCGGYAVQWSVNGGKCGVCGDAYNQPKPRLHEAGGEYGRGIISRHYFSGQTIDVEIELTANHKGRFEMYLCPNNNPRYEASQSCLDRYPLFVSGTRQVRYIIPDDSRKKEIFRYRVRLPPYVTCTQCVVQWTYYTGNMWGTCENGTEGLGCGQPETFRNCADIRIVTSTSGLPPQFVHNRPHSDAFASLRTVDLYRMGPQVYYPQIVKAQVCVATPKYRVVSGMDKWCENNCVNFPSNCPEEYCTCPDQCSGIGEIEGKPGADEYCQDQCIVYGASCPKKRCKCY
ncbi:uncharacterized protein LOC126838232 [Adelges cooleyi]|uniref:uncharacterized protein LOC126838232 n=1 Tax=Adelges cooleyi TaxID=133065 RepID=UPI00217F6863|nr:uncharacterized protein LOC126838232 [Adelges cooleyi]XP_050428453.1 uncharacterized protein LOC126838232 [Adelges cooleyi]XP_050428454.1 uncharacterized protein LOC126838232 [Adelges cooleyi]XP_050428455.1 uncharacterized protein LOC126838232 [Adelges cooleyi]